MPVREESLSQFFDTFIKTHDPESTTVSCEQIGPYMTCKIETKVRDPRAPAVEGEPERFIDRAKKSLDEFDDFTASGGPYEPGKTADEQDILGNELRDTYALLAPDDVRLVIDALCRDVERLNRRVKRAKKRRQELTLLLEALVKNGARDDRPQ